MSSRLAWLGGLLGVVGALIDLGVARACSCVPAQIHLPASGATNVPLNTRIWLEDQGPPGQAMARLKVSGGAEVPVSAGSILWAGGVRLMVLTPKAPLAPRTSYELTFPTQNSFFTTGDAADSTPPPVPKGRITSACAALTPGSSCGPSYQLIKFEVDGTEAPVVTITAGETPPPPVLDVYPLSWPPPGPYPVSFLNARTFSPQLSLGRGACMVWPTTATGGTIFYGALDLSGNFSGWQSGGPVRLPDLPGGGDAGAATSCIEYGDGGTPLDSAVDGPVPGPDAALDAAPVPVDFGVADAPSVDAPTMLPVPVDSGGPAPAPADASAGGPAVDAAMGVAPLDGGSAIQADRDGCSCRLGGRGSSGGVVAMGVVAAALTWRRRRR